MKKGIHRRDFLKLSLSGLAGLTLLNSSCNRSKESSENFENESNIQILIEAVKNLPESKYKSYFIDRLKIFSGKSIQLGGIDVPITFKIIINDPIQIQKGQITEFGSATINYSDSQTEKYFLPEEAIRSWKCPISPIEYLEPEKIEQFKSHNQTDPIPYMNIVYEHTKQIDFGISPRIEVNPLQGEYFQVSRDFILIKEFAGLCFSYDMLINLDNNLSLLGEPSFVTSNDKKIPIALDLFSTVSNLEGRALAQADVAGYILAIASYGKLDNIYGTQLFNFYSKGALNEEATRFVDSEWTYPENNNLLEALSEFIVKNQTILNNFLHVGDLNQIPY